jgi:hypothetical protein
MYRVLVDARDDGPAPATTGRRPTASRQVILLAQVDMKTRRPRTTLGRDTERVKVEGSSWQA